MIVLPARAAERVVVRPDGPSARAVELFVAVPEVGAKHPAVSLGTAEQRTSRVVGMPT